MDERTVRATAWTGRLGDRALGDLFDAATLHRAEAYAHEGAVLGVTLGDGGRLVLAEVQGTRPRPYQVLITAHGDLDAVPDELTLRCSCPVETACKHSAAVLLHLRAQQQSTVDETPSWRDVLETVVLRDEMEDERADEEARMPALPALAVFVSVRQTPPRAWGDAWETHVELRGTRLGKTGRHVRNLGWDALASGRSAYRAGGYVAEPLLRADHVELATELVTLADRGRRTYTYRDRTVVDLAEAGAAVWDWVRRAEAAGVDFVPGPGEHVDLAGAVVDVVVTLSQGREATGEEPGLRMSVHLDGLDDLTEVLPAAISVIGSPPHTLVVSGDDGAWHVRPLGGASGDLMALVGEPSVEIPAAEVDDFVARYLPSLRRHARVDSPDGALDVEALPWTRLVARVSSPDVRTLEIQWGLEQVLPARRTRGPGADDGGRATPFVPMPVVLRPDERRLLGEIGALRDLPDHAALAIGGTLTRLPERSRYVGTDAVAVGELVLPALHDDPQVRVEESGPLPGYREAEDDAVVHVSVDEADGTDWFDLKVEVSIEGEQVPLADLLDALSRGETVMLLPSGTWFRLDRPELGRLRELLDEAQELRDPETDGIRLSRFDLGYFDELVELGVVERQSASWAAQVDRLRSVEIDPAPPVPAQMDATLRPYQLDGYQWLSALWDCGLGGILADDMGLGKTMQVLATLARAQERDDLDAPVLVVAPTSVVGTWVGEAARWAPGLRVVARGRTEAKSRESLADAVARADVVVTTYAVARLDGDRFAEHRWRALVLDEAHMVKNHQSKTYRAIRAIPRSVTYAVTGTPVENSLMDLWSLLSLAAPGLYPRPDRFSAQWRRPVERGDTERLATLRRRVRPLMLRRTKDEVALDLPPKTVQLLEVVLSPAHRRTYDRHLQRERQRMLGLLKDPEANRVAILASLTRLRQLALDPRLVAADGEVSAGGAAPDSAKIEVLVEHLVELAREGHRALVFSQFTSFLALVRARLEREGIAHAYLDGSTADRQRVVDDFRQGDAPAFLISLKAGGVGLTLTEADYVFVLDPWWNPAAESQAIDRAHRIGQDKPVVVYRLVSAGTIEDKVVALQDRKRDLVARVVDDDPLSAGISADDLASLLDVEG